MEMPAVSLASIPCVGPLPSDLQDDVDVHRLASEFTAIQLHVMCFWGQIRIFTKAQRTSGGTNETKHVLQEQNVVWKLHETPACITADALLVLLYLIFFDHLFFFPFWNTQFRARNKCGSQEHFKTHDETGGTVKDLCIETCFLKKKR